MFLEDGDHSFRPRVASGYTLDDHLETAAEAVASFAALTVRGPES
jgi:predicted alpha/beta-hydrolase family hydrolase